VLDTENFCSLDIAAPGTAALRGCVGAKRMARWGAMFIDIANAFF